MCVGVSVCSCGTASVVAVSVVKCHFRELVSDTSWNKLSHAMHDCLNSPVYACAGASSGRFSWSMLHVYIFCMLVFQFFFYCTLRRQILYVYLYHITTEQQNELSRSATIKLFLHHQDLGKLGTFLNASVSWLSAVTLLLSHCCCHVDAVTLLLWHCQVHVDTVTLWQWCDIALLMCNVFVLVYEQNLTDLSVVLFSDLASEAVAIDKKSSKLEL